MLRPLLAAAVLLAPLPLTPAASAASALPKGKYWCEYYDDSTMGTILITSSSRYAYSSGKSGRYKAKGKRLTFTSGPMKGVFKHGEIKHDDDGAYFLLYDGDEYGHAYTDAKCFRTAS